MNFLREIAHFSDFSVFVSFLIDEVVNNFLPKLFFNGWELMLLFKLMSMLNLLHSFLLVHDFLTNEKKKN